MFKNYTNEAVSFPHVCHTRKWMGVIYNIVYATENLLKEIDQIDI